MSPSDALSRIPSEETSDLSDLFTRRIAHGVREVSRPIWFYISLNKNGYGVTRRLILSHGGKVRAEPGDRNTSKEICLVDPHSKAPKDGRPAYSVDYVQSCINAKRLLNVEDFRIPSVGRPRRTPPKQYPVVSHREHQPQQSTAEDPRAEKTTQGKDSEVTDDLPCIAQEEDQADNHNSARKGEKPRSVMGSTSAAQYNSNKRSIEVVEGSKHNDQQDHVRAEGQAEQAKLVAPKKRKGDWNVVTQTEQTNDLKSDSSPQPVSPFLDSMDWTKCEDNDITELCVQAKEAYQKLETDPNEVFTLACWTKFGKQGLLPRGRTAKACFKRSKELWQNGDGEDWESAENPSTQGGIAKIARLSPPETDGHGAPVNGIEAEHQPNTPQAPEALPQSQEQEDQRQEEPAPEKLKNANRLETREYIIELVARIAKRGKVTKRRAFRALRDERGQWKRALRHLTRRRETTDA